jgi:hypothetical protein
MTYNLVADPPFLVTAWNRVRENKGARSAGVDGRTAIRQGPNEDQPGGPVPPLPTYLPPRESPDANPELASRYQVIEHPP